MNFEQTDTTTIIKIWDKGEESKELSKFTECKIMIYQREHYIILEEAELKALERVIGAKFKQ